MAKWIVWASSGGPRVIGDEKRGALFYVEAESRADAAVPVEGMNLETDLKPGQPARVSNQPTTGTRALKRRP